MISKVNARRTTVDGTIFRYKVSSKPISKGVYEMNITIQSESHNGRKLPVTGIREHDHSARPDPCPEDFEAYKYRPTILRLDIEGFIKEALETGWDFRTNGRDTQLRLNNEPFRLIAYYEPRPPDFYHGRNYPAPD